MARVHKEHTAEAAPLIPHESPLGVAAAFNALPAHIVLIDAAGLIVMVNEAWRRFGRANGMAEGCGLGQNYLDVCDQTRGPDAATAREVADGIRGVLRGAATEFSIEYTCHSPSEERWFRMVAIPVLDPGIAAAVITHVNITERQTAMAARRDSEARLRAIFENEPECVKTLSLDGRVLEMNPAGLRLLEADHRAQAVGHNLESLVHPEDRDAFRQLHGKVCSGGSGKLQFRMTSLKGTSRWLEMHAVPLRESGDQVTAVLSVTRDITPQKEAAQSQLMFQRVFEGSMDALILVDRHGLILQGNTACASMFQYPVDSLPNRPLHDLLPERFRETHERHFHQYAAAPVGRSMGRARALLGRRSSGSEFPVEIMLSPLHGESDLLILAAIRDVTEQKAAELALRESDERFQLLAKATNDVMWDWDIKTDRLWWNEAIEDLVGIRRDDLEPSAASWITRIHSQDRDRVLRSVRDALEGDSAVWIDEYRLRRQDGSHAFVLDRGYIIRDESGQPLRMIGSIVDLTDRRAAETKLMQQAALLDSVPAAVLVRNLNHDITYWNHTAEQVYGWTAADAVGRSVRDLLYRDPAPFDAATQQVLLHGVWSGELLQVDRHGRELLMESRWTLVKGDTETPSAILVINTDITERRSLERQALRAQRMDSLGTLAAGIAHDLNNALAPILLSMGLLRPAERNEERLSLLETIEGSAERASSMVKQLLSFARGVESRRVPLMVGEILKDVEIIVNKTFLKEIDVQVSVPADLWTVCGDRTQLHQVLLNLCLNARSAMPRGGSLTLSARNCGTTGPPCVVLEVSDTGCGMPPEVLDRVFEPFFTTREIGQGTGLGLSMSLAIIKSHDGVIDVSSVLNVGTTFTIRLPAQLATGEDKRPLTCSTPPRGEGELVLVVDDEPPICLVAARILTTFGYRTIVASSGAEALDMYAAQRHDICLVLTDLMMPMMDGHAFIRALLEINADVRIVAMSGLHPKNKEAGSVDPRVKHFLTKPFTAEDMLEVLSQARREPC